MTDEEFKETAEKLLYKYNVVLLANRLFGASREEYLNDLVTRFTKDELALILLNFQSLYEDKIKEKTKEAANMLFGRRN